MVNKLFSPSPHTTFLNVVSWAHSCEVEAPRVTNHYSRRLRATRCRIAAALCRSRDTVRLVAASMRAAFAAGDRRLQPDEPRQPSLCSDAVVKAVVVNSSLQNIQNISIF